HRHADDAAGVPDGPRHQLRRGLRGGEDDVALVLPVLVVHDHDRLAGRDVGDRPLDAVEPDRGAHAVSPSAAPALGAGWSVSLTRVATRRSTYFASTSTSRLTRSPGARVPSVVRARVSGMRLMVKRGGACGSSASPSWTSTTVSETPSTVIEPFGTR